MTIAAPAKEKRTVSLDKNKLKSKKLRNKIVACCVAVLALVMTMTPGADGDGDITEKLIAVAMAIDYDQGMLKTTVSAALPKPGSSEGGSVVSVPISGSGQSVAACMSDIERKTGKSLETGLCGVVIAGDELAKQGVNVVLSVLLSSGTVSPGAYFALADDCDGCEILKDAASMNFDSATILTELMNGATRNTGAKPVTLLQFVSDSSAKAKSATAPLIKMKKSHGGTGGGEEDSSGGAEQKSEPCSINRNALFLSGKLVGKLSREASLGLSYYDSHTKKGWLVCPNFIIGNEDVGTLSGEISKVSLTNKTFFSDGVPHSLLTAKITLKAADRERVNAVAMRKNLSPDQINTAYKSNFERCVKKAIEKTLSESVAFGCDVFETEQKLYRFHTKEYKQFVSSGGKVLDECKFEVSAEITVS